jgi:outer membrane protein TolC
VASSGVINGVKAEADMGERNQFEVLDSEQEMLDAQASYVRAQALEKLAALRLIVELRMD